MTAAYHTSVPSILGLIEQFWPTVYPYDKQRDIVESVEQNVVTVVPAGNQLGKDFIAGLICVSFFLTRHPCRIVTTSAKEQHLRVLWGEIGRFIQSCKYPLDHRRGGPLICNHQDVKRVVNGERDPLSYMIGMVAGSDSIASMGGHHVAHTGDGVPRTLLVIDEASSVSDEYLRIASPWANRVLIIGNCWPTSNFFFRAVHGNPETNDPGGDLPRPPDDRRPGLLRKVIQITARDSPNVAWGLAQQAAGEEPTDEVLVEGVKSWGKYQDDLVTLDAVSKCVSLDARFWQGKDVLLFPPDRLDASAERARELRAADLAGRLKAIRAGLPIPPGRTARAMGIDPAQGGDNTAFCVIDELGVLELLSMKTPDTNIIVGECVRLMRKWGLDPRYVAFDRGCGKEHADRMRAMGFDVRTVGFGEAVSQEPQRGTVRFGQKVDVRESRYAFKNRRAEMYGDLAELLDADRLGGQGHPFAIPDTWPRLRQQLAVFPRKYDGEGRLYLPPKTRTEAGAGSKTRSLTEMIGHSPDESDALVLAVHAMLKPSLRPVAGGV